MRVSLLAAVLAVAAPAAADDTDWRFHCDGTDPWLLAELDEAMRSGVGYGETWDETVCNQGNLVLGEGVRPVKPKRDPAAPVATPTPTPTPTTKTPTMTRSRKSTIHLTRPKTSTRTTCLHRRWKRKKTKKKTKMKTKTKMKMKMKIK
jgi:hypothetical protein